MAQSTGPLAVMWSGGKDGFLALRRAQEGGLPVTTLVTLLDEASGRVRFHGTPRSLIEAQAAALGLALLAQPTTWQRYEATFTDTLRSLAAAGCAGVVFGNLHLADVRAWFEERVRAVGLVHIEPLWGEPPAALLAACVGSGLRAMVTCRDVQKLDASWLGRELDAAFARDIARLPGVDPAGEHGEYHTFVFDGPGFAQPVAWRAGSRRTDEGFETLELDPP